MKKLKPCAHYQVGIKKQPNSSNNEVWFYDEEGGREYHLDVYDNGNYICHVRFTVKHGFRVRKGKP